ncbi:galactose-1-phosphate uridylyltransferase [Hydrogenimonas sp.]
MSELRYDPIRDLYALIAPERLHRPDCYRPAERKVRKKKRRCPFCEGNESMTPHEIFALRENDPDTPGWKSRVVPNLYKAVKIEAPWQSEEEGIYHKWDGFGAHEVIVDTPRHLLRMDEWRGEEYVNWLYTMRARLCDLKNDIRLLYVALFKNHGHYAGSTQPHPHTQLIALPAVPPEVLARLQRAHRYFHEHGRPLVSTMVAAETKEGMRVVKETSSFVALCPYASAFAFETEIVAKAPLSDLCALNEATLRELAGLFGELIGSLYRQLGDFDFNVVIETPPLQRSFSTEAFFDEIPKICRLSLRILPRLYRLGGFELGSGVPINPVTPEEAASLLRESLKERR